MTLRENLRTLRIAAWLGWQVEGNWADPLVFFIFTLLKPMASALILLVMYQVIAGGQRADFFGYLFISNAFFTGLVIQLLVGLSWTIIDDRENYKMLKYIFTSPARHLSYLVGRAAAKGAIGMMTTLILLGTGVAFLGLHLDVARVQWGWLGVYFVLGIIILAGMGLILAGISLVIARNAFAIGQVVAGSLLLFSGALFPVDTLPSMLRSASLAMPITYWLEGLRRALIGGIPMTSGTNPQPLSPALAVYDNWQLLLILGVCAVVSAVGSYLFFNFMEHQAKERGMIDRLTGY